MTMSALAPQIILYNGTLATWGDKDHFRTQAVAVGNGKILKLGRDEDVLNLAGPDTERINLDGRLVVPGFIDAHIHFFEVTGPQVYWERWRCLTGCFHYSLHGRIINPLKP